ncbi:MAG: hypothetical protein AB8D52_06230 [Gammaproteobacteria bacterium]
MGAAFGLVAVFGFLFVRERAEIVAKSSAEKLVTRLMENWKNDVLPKMILEQIRISEKLVESRISDDDVNDLAENIDEEKKDGE